MLHFLLGIRIPNLSLDYRLIMWILRFFLSIICVVVVVVIENRVVNSFVRSEFPADMVFGAGTSAFKIFNLWQTWVWKPIDSPSLRT